MTDAGRQRSTLGLAVGITVVWIVVAIALFGIRYWSGHDESVYVAKALGGRDPFIWRPHRALGVSALLSPVTGLGFGVTASRVVMLAFNAVALGIGLVLWIRLLGRWVVIGPSAILLSWLGLNHASAILPNLPTAMTLFATLPALWLTITEPTRLRQGGALAGFVLIGLIRPTALFWLTVGLLVAALADPVVRTHVVALARFVVVAVPLALLTWSVESFVSFDITPLERVKEGRAAIGNYEHDNVVRTLLGNVAHPSGSHFVSLVALSVALGASVVLTIVALRAAEPSRRGALTMAVCVGTAKLVAYVLFPSDGSARFMLAGFLCASVGVGVGLRSLVAGRAWRIGAVATLLTVALIWQLAVAREHAQGVLGSRNAMAAAVTDMRTISDGETCYYESNASFPSFYVGTSCDGTRAVDADDSMQRMEQRADTAHSFLVWRGAIDLRPGWSVVDIGIDARWDLFHYAHESGF